MHTSIGPTKFQPFILAKLAVEAEMSAGQLAEALKRELQTEIPDHGFLKRLGRMQDLGFVKLEMRVTPADKAPRRKAPRHAFHVILTERGQQQWEATRPTSGTPRARVTARTLEYI